MASEKCATECAFYNQCRALQAVNSRRDLAETHRRNLWRTADMRAATRAATEASHRELEDSVRGFALRDTAHWFERAAQGEISAEEAQRQMEHTESVLGNWREGFDEENGAMQERLRGVAEKMFGKGGGPEAIADGISRATGVIEEMERLQAIAVAGCEEPGLLRKIGNLLSYGRGYVPPAELNPYRCHNPQMVEAMSAYDTGPISGQFDSLPMPIDIPRTHP